jgi:hypothetical protein
VNTDVTMLEHWEVALCAERCRHIVEPLYGLKAGHTGVVPRPMLVTSANGCTVILAGEFCPGCRMPNVNAGARIIEPSAPRTSKSAHSSLDKGAEVCGIVC